MREEYEKQKDAFLEEMVICDCPGVWPGVVVADLSEASTEIRERLVRWAYEYGFGYRTISVRLRIPKSSVRNYVKRLRLVRGTKPGT